MRNIKWSRWLLIFFALLAAIPLILSISYLIANHTNGAIQSSGETRRYLIYVPDSYDSATPTPLVITIHGFAQWPAHQMELSDWHKLADEKGFIVVFPAGTGFPMRWSAHGRAGIDENPLRDVEFIRELIDQLKQEYAIDPDRIYANGLSNGGGMSFMLSCYLSDRIAAVGSVAGAYLLPWEKCNPERPVPMIVFHGTEDPVVPFNGGPSRSFDIPFPNIPDWVVQAAAHNGCRRVNKLPRAGEVSGSRYTDCYGGAEVVFYQVEGGGHAWPGGGWLPGWLVGHITLDVDATRLIWEFFIQHPMNE